MCCGFRYDDFFTSQKKTSQKKRPKYDDESDDMDMDEHEIDDSDQVIYIIPATTFFLLGLPHLCEGVRTRNLLSN